MNVHLTKTRLAVAIATVVALVPATAVATHVFADVDDSRFFADAVEWAAANGITTGTSPTTFDPDRGVTRGESVTFLNRYNTNVAPKLLTATAADPAATTLMDFVLIPDMTLDVVVPPGGSRALITFSSESNCFQDPKASVFCEVQAVIDPSAAVVCLPPLPLGCAPPGEVFFDSVQHGANSADAGAIGTHSFQWIAELSPGIHTIEMQSRVAEANAVFTLFFRVLSVQLFPV